MNSCTKCGTELDPEGVCRSCDRQHGSSATETFPLVTWPEVEAHLMKRLGFDDEWVVRADNQITWFPWFLPQRIFVRAEGTIGDWTPDNWMLITSEIDIAELDETWGIALAAKLNKTFSMGVFVYIAGILRLQSTLHLNPLGRGLLSLFHEQVLAQAAKAHEVAGELSGQLGAVILQEGHPVSGIRKEPDELVALFSGGTFQLPLIDGFDEVLASVRAHELKDLMRTNDFETGFDNDEVTYFMAQRAWVGIGVIEDSDDYRQYGPGLSTSTMFSDRLYRLDDEAANELNVIVGAELQCSQFGPFKAVPEDAPEEVGATMSGFLSYGYLAENRMHRGQLATAILNVAFHLSASIARLDFFMDSLPAAVDDGSI